MNILLVYNEYYLGRIYRYIYKSIGLHKQSVIYHNELTLEFIQSIFNSRYNGNVIEFSVDKNPLKGGLNGEIHRIRLKWEQKPNQHQILPTSVILKSSIESFDKLKFSYDHQASRESDFYKYLLDNSIKGGNNNNEMKYSFIPIVYYSNKSYGGSYSMILQDISPPPPPPPIDDGSNRSSSNNSNSYVVASHAMGNQCWGIPDYIDIDKYNIFWIVDQCFKETLKLHIDNWRNKEMITSQTSNQLKWLKNLDYYNAIGKENYENYYQIKLKSTWENTTLPLIEKINKENSNSLQHLELFKNIVENEYFKSITKWEQFQNRIDINKSNTAFTIVHGDFHAGNVMIPVNSDGKSNHGNNQIYLLDYTEIGIGCPFSDLSQFIISNCSIEFRRANEKQLFKDYYDNLIKSGKVDEKIFTFDYCFHLYKRGGIEKWIWFNILLSEMVPEFAFIFYFNQLSTFIDDHYDSNLFN